MKKKGIVIINKDFSADWLPILKRSGINTVGLHALYQYGGLEGHLNWLLKEDTQALIAEFEKNGIMIEHQIHAVDWLLPRSLFSQRPDWFRMDQNGDRTANWNFCVSNEEALEFLENSAYKLALLLRQKSHQYYIWSDDCEGALCCCEKCRRHNGADQNMLLMQRILKGLKRYDEKAQLSFLAYQDSMALPTIPPDKDMFLEFAPIDRNHQVALCDEDEANARMRESLRKLLEIFPAESTQVLEYFLDVSLFCQWKRENAQPLSLDEERLSRDVAWYKSMGVGGITSFAGFIDAEWRAQYGEKDILLYGKVLNKA